jgi:F0F1-type ATP synthase membrane subunit b/b'
MRSVVLILVAILLGGGATYAWLYYGGIGGEKATSVAFVESYGNYAEIADQVEAFVHVPGTEGNSDRQELLSLLNAMLTDTMADTEREGLARIAFTHLDTIKKEIDAAQSAQAKLYTVLQDFDNASRMFKGIELRTQASEIVALARTRAELSAHITSILSETNDHTYSIITRILADHGALTQEHITEINAATTMAEDRFATLEGLYTELIDKKQAMDQAFTVFTHTGF